MRLIDVDDFMEYLGFDNTDEEREENIGQIVTLEDFDRQETAYDVDKVINMLKEKAEHAETKSAEYDEKGDITMMDIWDAEAKSYRNAIEIVKSGGVEND